MKKQMRELLEHSYEGNKVIAYIEELEKELENKVLAKGLVDKAALKEFTLEFNAFKLPADSSLARMSKEEFISYIHMLHHNWAVCDEQLNNVLNHAERLNNSFEKSLNILAEKCECESCWCKDCKVRCTDEDYYDSWKKECKSRWRKHIENEYNCN